MISVLQRSLFPPNLKNRYPLHLLHTLSSNPSPNLSLLLQGPLPHSHLLQIHARVYLLNLHQDNLIATRLINHYPSHLSLKIFHNLKTPNTFSFNAVIRVLSEDGIYENSFLIFKLMKETSISPNEFTFSFLLKASLRSRNDLYVKLIHIHVLKMGWMSDYIVCNGLVVGYIKGVRNLVSGKKVFDEMPDRSMVFVWTSLIEGLAKGGGDKDVFEMFVKMVKEDLRPEDDTMVSVLSACSSVGIGEVQKWVGIFEEFVDGEGFGKRGSDSIRIVLVYLCGKCGKIEKSTEWFNAIGECGKRSVLPWNAMIGAYVLNGCPMEAVDLFRLMVKDPNRRPNHVTMVSVISACSQIGDLDFGRWVHDYIKVKGRRDILEHNAILATALIDMYSKCGSLDKAREVFDHMVSKDVVAFNAMIMGLAVNGKGEEALKLFSKMQGFHVIPNAGTFLSILCACSHSGLLEEGRCIFLDMSSLFSIPPKLEHYASYIDLLARVGLVEEAFEVVSSMPFKPNSFIWGALLGGCLLHSKFELAEDVSKRLVEMDPENSGGYVMMSNAFAVDRRWGEVSGLRGYMREKRVRKQPGHSWISINAVIYEFLAGSPSHPEIESIYHTLDGLVKEMKVASP